MTFKITVNQETCIGCGACTAVCDNFELVEGKAKPIKDSVEKASCNLDAKDTCPVDAILVQEE